ncbi:MAG: hypothetical protein R2940_10690 [Syntrophotaleaceae bacterium]
MKMRWLGVLLAVAAMMLPAAPSQAEIEFFGTAKIKPTFYDDFDFQSSKNDGPIVNEGGVTAGEHIRGELRLGWSAKGDKWSVKMIAEADIIYEKDNVDRSFYNTTSKEGLPNSGAEFGIERAELLYSFLPCLELETGWDIRALDIQTGGLLYGDDHPFLGFRGKIVEGTRYEALYIPVQNRYPLSTASPPEWRGSSADDWRVYSLKLIQDFGGEGVAPKTSFFGNSAAERDILKFSVSPFYAYSDNDSRQAKVHYFGLEVTGQAGWFKPSFEIVGADGDFDSGNDISSWAMFGGLEMTVSKVFNPYVAFRYTQGDDDASDDDVEGWVGITDIGRFTPLMGMDGNILGEDLGQSYGATLYSYSPERAVGSNLYGGISNRGSGDNPGQKLIAVGSRGDLSALLPGLMYKTQAFFIWYDETDNLTNVANPGQKVDDYAGTTVDMQLAYAFNKNFAIDYIFSTFIPGEGIEDQFGDDNAYVHAITLSWTY